MQDCFGASQHPEGVNGAGMGRSEPQGAALSLTEVGRAGGGITLMCHVPSWCCLWHCSVPGDTQSSHSSASCCFTRVAGSFWGCCRWVLCFRRCCVLLSVCFPGSAECLGSHPAGRQLPCAQAELQEVPMELHALSPSAESEPGASGGCSRELLCAQALQPSGSFAPALLHCAEMELCWLTSHQAEQCQLCLLLPALSSRPVGVQTHGQLRRHFACGLPQPVCIPGLPKGTRG